MPPLQLIACVWTLIATFGADVAVCQDSIENRISCYLNGRNLSHNEIIHYNRGNQSIVVCEVPKDFTIHATNTNGVLKKIDGDFRVIGIPLNHAPNYIQLHTVRDNDISSAGFRLNFFEDSSDGHQSETCQVDMPNSSIEAQSSEVQNGPIQCWLNNVPLMDHSTIHVTKGYQLNIVRCSVNQTDLKGEFGPQQLYISDAWTPYDGTVPHHIVMLQLKDLISDSATSTEVRMNAVFMLGSEDNESSFPFIFTVTNETTDHTPDTTTATMNDVTVTTPTTTAPMPIISLDSNIDLKPEEIAGSVVGAILVLVAVGLLVAVAVGVFVYCVRNRKTKESTKSQVDMSKIEEGVTEGDEVHNQSHVNMIPNN